MITPNHNVAITMLCLLLGMNSTGQARSIDVQTMEPKGSLSLIRAVVAPQADSATDREQNVPLHDVVFMVQERFNATAVKTDTVFESGQWIYRIRLLSADKSRVWTVNVDARTGRVY